jgi:hypothetical protein
MPWAWIRGLVSVGGQQCRLSVLFVIYCPRFTPLDKNAMNGRCWGSDCWKLWRRRVAEENVWTTAMVALRCAWVVGGLKGWGGGFCVKTEGSSTRGAPFLFGSGLLSSTTTLVPYRARLAQSNPSFFAFWGGVEKRRFSGRACASNFLVSVEVPSRLDSELLVEPRS